MINNMKDQKKIPVKKILKEFHKGFKPFMAFGVLGGLAFAIGAAINIVTPLYYKKFFDQLVLPDNKMLIAQQLVRIIVVIVILNVLRWIFYRLANHLIIIFESRSMAQLKQNAFAYVVKHSHNFFSNNFTGSLVQKINRFSRAFEKIADSIFFIFIPLFVSVLGAIIITLVVFPLAAWVILGWVIFFCCFSYFFYRWKVKYDIEAASADSHTTSILADNITNNNAILLFNGYQTETNNYNQASNNQAVKMIKAWQLSSWIDSAQFLVVILVEFFVFYFAIQSWVSGHFPLGNFVLVQVYIISLAQQIWGVSRVIKNIYEGMSDANEMVELILLPYEIKDARYAKDLKAGKGEIVFKNVSFAFKKQRLVLDKINSRIVPGEKVALVGVSGSGKTTFVRLILRFHDVVKGVIYIDKQDISKVTQTSLRAAISLVPQDPVLFHRSLMDNIRYGRQTATDQEVMTVARLSNCAEFIEKLPEGYNTFVGERGIKLSGGERQRIAIARAMLKNAPILILDEATSSLDSHSEHLIQEALDNLMRGRTTIVIAHRLSTIRKMDRILVMDNGKIIEEGSHQDLIKHQAGIYQKLWNLQMSGFIIAS